MRRKSKTTGQTARPSGSDFRFQEDFKYLSRMDFMRLRERPETDAETQDTDFYVLPMWVAGTNLG